MKVFKNYTLIILVLLLALFLRVYAASWVPPSLDWDEVATSYNAYSISQTGKDEYGHVMPVLFESFNDYKMPGYIYLLVPLVKFFGLNDTIVRLPSAIIGTMSVLAIYLLARKISSKHSVGLVAAALSVISPWHLQFSRVAFEPVGVLFFIPLGLYFFLKGLEDKKFLYFSAISFALSFYFYYSVRLFVPLLFLILIARYRKELKVQLRTAVLAVILGVFLLLPLGVNLLKPQTASRLSVVSVFSDRSIGIKAAQKNLEAGNTLISRIQYHRYVAYGQEVVAGYLKHFSLQFLFLTGDPNMRHGVRGMGVLYLVDLPFFLMGLLFFARSKNKVKWVILGWLFLSPLPAAFAQPTPHSLRTIASVPVYQIIIATGLVFSVRRFKAGHRLAMIVLVAGVYAVSFGIYLNNYYGRYISQSALDWGYGYRELYRYLAGVDDRYDAFYITGEYWKPYIYYLYYNQFPPASFQKNVNHAQIGKYYFAPTSWDTDRYWEPVISFEEIYTKDRVLFALKPDEVSQLSKFINTRRVGTISTGDKIVFELVEKTK